MKTKFLTTCMLLTFGPSCFGDTLEGHLLPAKCKNEAPKAHTAKCALLCKSGGFGVVTADGKYVPFMPAGNKKAIVMLQSTGKTADLQVAVQGTRQGAFLAVELITWK